MTPEPMEAHMPTEELLRWMDGELPGEEARAVADHVEGCTECRARADALRDVSATLAAAARDIPVPASLRRAPAPPSMSRPGVRRAPRSASARRAIVGGGLLAACALALVAQPVRRRVAALLEGTPRAGAPVAAPTSRDQQASPPRETVVGIAPRGASFVVELAAVQPGDSVRLRATTAREVTVRVPSGAAVWSTPDGVRLAHPRGAGVTYTLDVAPGVGTVRLRGVHGMDSVVARAELAARGSMMIAIGPR